MVNREKLDLTAVPERAGAAAKIQNMRVVAQWIRASWSVWRSWRGM
jgi:hypothetical protein